MYFSYDRFTLAKLARVPHSLEFDNEMMFCFVGLVCGSATIMAGN